MRSVDRAAEAARLLAELPPEQARLARQLAAAHQRELKAEEAWRKADAATTEVVAAMRNARVIWDVIGAVLGLAPSNVVTKYKRRLEPTVQTKQQASDG